MPASHEPAGPYEMKVPSQRRHRRAARNCAAVFSEEFVWRGTLTRGPDAEHHRSKRLVCQARRLHSDVWNQAAFIAALQQTCESAAVATRLVPAKTSCYSPRVSIREPAGQGGEKAARLRSHYGTSMTISLEAGPTPQPFRARIRT
jgi:hypothetical protein